MDQNKVISLKKKINKSQGRTFEDFRSAEGEPRIGLMTNEVLLAGLTDILSGALHLSFGRRGNTTLWPSCLLGIWLSARGECPTQQRYASGDSTQL